VGHPSRYRPEESKIVAEFVFRGVTADLDDNFLKVHISADTSSEALNNAGAIVDRFTEHSACTPAGRSWPSPF
jgi:hypothetical protein